MKTGTKMSNAIERIKGYCTEVTQAQWEEWKSVCKDFGIDSLGKTWDEYWRFCFVNDCNELERIASEEAASHHNITIIPFPDFLAKLRGEEEWTPKAGEMVECRDGVGADWFLAKYVGHDGKWAVCRPEHHPLGHYTLHNDVNFRPITPAITRAEAEQQLGKRIID